MATLALLAAGCRLAAAVPPSIKGNVTFHPPVSLGEASWGVTMFAAWNDSAHAVMMPTGLQVSTDGGKSYTQQAYPAGHGSAGHIPISSNLVPGPAAGQVHDFGNVSAHRAQEPASGWTSLSSPAATSWALSPDGTVIATTTEQPIRFSGLPVPIHCDKSYGACPIRLQGSGLVHFGDGTMLQSAIVFYDGVPKFPRATSVVVFKSSDGWDWVYQGTIANATDYAFSQEGPNEHDLAMLDFGQVLAVVRLDAGDGLASHPYVPYYYTISRDGGVTWPKMEPMVGTGCARPRLLTLGGGYAPLLMSGGRMKIGPEGSDDNLLWIDWQGAKWPAAAPQWEMYALSYYHNLLAPPGTPKFTAGVNSTKGSAQTAAYTALIAVGKCEAVVLYDLLPHKGGEAEGGARAGRTGFSMRVTIHLDEGGETGVHC